MVEAKGKQVHVALILREVVESVTNTVDRGESKPILRSQAKLLANPGDVGVNGAGLHLLIVAPDLESNLIARDRLAHLPEQELGTLEFFFRQSNGSSVSLRQVATLAIG